MRFDHIAIAAENLDDGTAYVVQHLGVPVAPGGKHALMGTHNRLLSLGPEIYLEVITIDPAAPTPQRARWFDLDEFSGPPRVSNWAVACDDIARTIRDFPYDTGSAIHLERGDLRWQMSVPEDGKLPLNGACPAFIEWAGPQHPAQRLPDQGCRLEQLTLTHPNAESLRAALDLSAMADLVTFENGLEFSLRAAIQTPHNGVVTL